MSLTFHTHPLASFCHKALIALYDNDTPFESILVDLSDAKVREAFRKISPFGKMPALVDHARKQTINEATIVIEYLDRHYRGATKFIPADADHAWQVRMWDRFFDSYLHDPMQRYVLDALRPVESRDAFGTAEAKRQMLEAYGVIEQHMIGREWAGTSFSLADCSAAPALFYSNTIVPLGSKYPNTRAYLGRLMTRPSYARVLSEAEPYFSMFPLDPKPQRTLGAA